MNENLNSYYIFHVTARCGSVSQAAKELFISQPAISKSIRKLEQNLHTVLFLRTSRGVRLTEEGSILYQHTTEAFRSLQNGEELLSRHQSLGIAHLRIGVSTTLCKHVLLPYLQQFIEAYPHVRISISCQSTYKTLALLDENKIDIGLVGEPTGQKNYPFMPLLSIQDTFAATPAYLAHLQTRSESEDILQSANFMLLDEENITRQYVNQVFLEQQIHPEHILEVSNMDLLIDFAKIGMGAACVIREFIKAELDTGLLVEPDLPVHFEKRNVGFIWKKEDQNLPVVKNFLSMHQ